MPWMSCVGYGRETSVCLTLLPVWAETVPNLLIGLREGLEAGLVVSILLAAVRKLGEAGDGSQRVWAGSVRLGVVAAVAVAGCFAAVLTFTTSQLSNRAQDVVSGLLSALAVGLVTAMVFWMRRTSSTLSAQLRGDITRAAAIGAGALTLTSFLAVGREGLETTLFVWAGVRASGSTLAPVVGAFLGLGAAVLLCWLLYRQAVRLKLGKFFNVTAFALIVIAAGVVAYGLGDLQEAGWLPGRSWIAFDLGARLDPNSWWVSLLTGVTDLSVKMTVLQVTVWFAYLAVVTTAFVRAGRDTVPDIAAERSTEPSRWENLVAARPWAVAAVLVVIPVAVTAGVMVMMPSRAGADTVVSVTAAACAPEWSSATAGAHTYMVNNKSRDAGEVTLTNDTGGVVAEIEVIGPATTVPMTAELGYGSYTFRCYLSGQRATASAPVRVSGSGGDAAVAPVTADDLAGPNGKYQDSARTALDSLHRDVQAIRTDLAADNLAAAKRDWLAAQMNWERVGASYDSFGDKGQAVAGLPSGLPGGVTDPGFTGLRRLEYGLYHGQSVAQLTRVVERLGPDIDAVQADLGSDDLAGDPTNLPVRAHEILEDSLRDHLSGIDDLGGGAAYPQTSADVEITRTILAELSPLITARSPQLVGTASAQLDTLDTALRATRAGEQWQSPSQVPPAARQRVNAAIGNALETLSAVPRLLEVPTNH